MKAAWYAIRRKTAMAAAIVGVAAAAEIYIYGDIGESWWEDTVSAAQFVRELNELDVDAITVRINSIGGSVPDGLAIFNAMRRHRAEITTEVDGMAFSIASLIAMGGDKVHMASNAMLMIHAPWTYAAGNSAELRDLADQLDTWAAAMSTSYAMRTGDQPAMMALLTDGKDHYYTADEALQAKFIDAVTDPMPVAASAARELPLSRYRSLPPALQAVATPAASAAPSDEEDPMMKSRSLLLMAAIGAAGAAAVGGGGAPAAPAAAGAITPEAARIEGAQAEAARRNGIVAAFAKFSSVAGVADLQRQCEADASCTVEAAGRRLLDKLGEGSTPVAGAHVVTVEDEADKFRAAVVQSIMARAGVRNKDGVIRADGSNPYRGRRLTELAEVCARRAGRKTDGMDQMGIVGAAFTQGTSDFPIILQNVMHKTLQGAYAIAPDTWSRFCKRGSVTDFRAHNRYRLGSIGNLEGLNENGEFKTKSIPDGEKASITAGTKGNLINISRQAIINDDMGAFVGLSDMLGRAAKRTVEADVYATLALNSGFGPTMPDGNSLFHASHANVVASGAAPTAAQLDAMRVLLGSQKDLSGNDYLDIVPAVLLVPLGLGGAARVAVNSEYDPDTNSKLQRVNIARDIVRDIVDTPRLTGTPYYMFADADNCPVLEVAFLDGNDMPFLDQQTGWSVDGSQFKVRLDYAVGGIDWKGAVRNAGA